MNTRDKTLLDTPPAEKKLIPFGGYYTNREPAHDEELTSVGPGTPLGEYMRRFWQPVCMSMELTDTPRFLKILGEELVCFRDGSGAIGMLHAHCVHRGASLEYGKIEQHGISCCYHGMVFDVDGTCLRVPFPEGEHEEGERYRCSIRQGAYKAFERHGLVFAYMGPPEQEPLPRVGGQLHRWQRAMSWCRTPTSSIATGCKCRTTRPTTTTPWHCTPNAR